MHGVSGVASTEGLVGHHCRHTSCSNQHVKHGGLAWACPPGKFLKLDTEIQFGDILQLKVVRTLAVRMFCLHNNHY